MIDRYECSSEHELFVLCSPGAKRSGSTLKHMVCAKCLLLFIDKCTFLSDCHFAINVFSCLSNAWDITSGSICLSEIPALSRQFSLKYPDEYINMLT